MMTVDQIAHYIARIIAEDQRTGNRAGLKQTQTAAGMLMAAAAHAGDKPTAQRFKLLAAQAANICEELAGES